MTGRRTRETVFLATSLAVVAAYVFQNMDLLSDSFWYVATGRFVLDGHGLPAVDPFSFSAVRSRWIVHMPGSVVLFAWLDRHLGLGSLVAVATVVETAALALLWLSRARTFAARIVSLPLVLFAVYLQRADLCARGQVFGDLAFVALLLLVARVREGARLPLVFAPLLGAAWVNLHSSFPLGVLVPLVTAFGLLFEPRGERRAIASLVVFAAGLGVGTMLNPYGLELVRDVLALASHPTTFRQVLFMPPDFTRSETLLTYAIAAAALVLRARAGAKRLAVPDALLVSVFALAAASGVRYLPHLLYVSIFALLPEIEHSAAALEGRASRAWGPIAILASVLSIGFAAHVLRTPKDPFQNVPIEAARFVKEHHPTGNVINDYHWGGFLLYVWEGRPKLFIDGRSYLYFNGVFEDASDLARLARGYEELLDVYDAKLALLERGSPLAVILVERHGWKPVFADRLAVVLERP